MKTPIFPLQAYIFLWKNLRKTVYCELVNLIHQNYSQKFNSQVNKYVVNNFMG